MIPWNIIVADFAGEPSTVEALTARLRAGWTHSVPLSVTTGAVNDFEGEDSLRAIDGVVVVAGTVAEAARLIPDLTVLEEAGVAVCLLLKEAPDPDDSRDYSPALVESLEADTRLLCAKLVGLLHRQTEISRLRKEVSIAYRYHGGLKGEMARIHDELQLAAMVQREFLPRDLPKLYGVEFAALWRPAHYVSGDIYDVTRLDDDHIGVFVADAVGHGVPAALMTMVICRSLTLKIISGSTYRIIEPSDVLGRLNQDMIRRQGRSTRFATAVYAVINCRSRTMRLAGAGHPPPILLSADGSAHDLETTGGLLGVFDSETYEQIELSLGVGDRLLFHSDGFEQAFPNAQADAYERRLPTMRYRQEFERVGRADTAAEVIQLIGRLVDDQQGSLHQVDDLTLVCMHAGALVPEADEAPSTPTSAKKAAARAA